MQQPVTQRMAQRVVDPLKFVQIQVEQRETTLLPTGPTDGSLQTVLQEPSVGQISQQVVLRHMLHTGEQLLALYYGGNLRAHVLQQLFVSIRVDNLAF